ncbi:TlpA family protein disulfide reductase [Aeromicrobium sp. CF4.19]|uniref:TlpA family protein disulfide reductase n=1 Tax=Aeromicrobium sp. CF4.19 TaxID=3373082 RepID=UPI003EE79545
MSGLIVLLLALALAAVVALVWKRSNGRFRDADEPQQDDDREVLSTEEIGADLGDRVTLVQFSTSFCSPCRATRALLADVVSRRPDVAHVEIDAESHLDLVRRLDVRRTPTVVVLDATGTIVGRASGLPSREQVETVLDGVPAR